MKPTLIVLTALICLTFFARAGAQTTTGGRPIRVEVIAGNDDPTSQTVANMISARIGTGSRYALVSSTDADILLSVDCLRNIVSGRQVGIACHTDVSYWPVDGVSLSCILVGDLGVGSEVEVTEGLFDAFVQETSDEKLAKATKDFKHYLNSAIARYPRGVD